MTLIIRGKNAKQIADRIRARLQDDPEVHYGGSPMRIVGFEFHLVTPKGRRWARVQGAGGLIGDGCLHAWADGQSPQKSRKIRTQLLNRVRLMADRGPLLVLRDDKLPPEERFERVVALGVLRIREIKGRQRRA